MTRRSGSTLFAVTTLLALCLAAPSQAQYTEITLPDLNHNLQDMIDGSNYPTGGNFVFGGVPFTIADGTGGVNNIWHSRDDANGILDIPVNVFGVTEAHTLINLWFGTTGTNIATIEFFGSDTGYFSKNLIVGTDVRDHLAGEFSNTINGTTTTQVFSVNTVRLDKQFFALPADFADETLDSIRITVNNGGRPQGEPFLVGVTVFAPEDVVPEPGTMALVFALGLSGTAFAFRRRR